MTYHPADLVARTERLVLRRWREEDAEAFVALNADPEVMRYVGGVLDRAGSDALLTRLQEGWRRDGYGRAAVEDSTSGDLLGFVGLGPHAAVPGEVEIGWRLAGRAWGRGLATEAAVAMLDLAFDTLGLERIVSVTVPDNAASLAVMRHIGMRHWRDLRHEGLTLAVHEMRAGDPRPKAQPGVRPETQRGVRPETPRGVRPEAPAY
jgi:RimJ/RimL family protein N-acetyltransferase